MNDPLDSEQTMRRLDAFYDRLAAAPARALLMDYDGTLAPFRVQRDEAVPYPGLRPILDELQVAGHTRLVVISGRYTRDLLPLLGMANPPEIWGSHGWERRFPGGRTEIGRMDPRALQGLAEADDWVELQGLEPLREVKPGCLAIHMRGLPPVQAAELHQRLLRQWRPLAARSGLDVHQFDGGVELRVPGRTKADAVGTILAELPREAAVAFLGDDRTDEEGFAALAGRGLRVLVRPEFRPTWADVWLKPPGELFDFLRRWQAVASHHAQPANRKR